MRRCDFMASMDFGSYDGSCTQELRTMVENALIVALVKTTDCHDSNGSPCLYLLICLLNHGSFSVGFRYIP